MNTKTITATLAVAATSCLLTLPLPAQQQRRRAVAEIFPDSTYAVVSFAGLMRCKTAARQVGPFRLVQTMLERAGIDDPSKLYGRELGQVTTKVNRALAQAGLDAADVRTLLGGPVAFGLGRPTLYAAGTPSILLAFDVRGRERRAEEIVEQLERTLGERFKKVGLQHSTRTVAGEVVTRIDVQQNGVVVARALVDGYLMIGTGVGLLTDCVRTIKGEAKSIAANPAYASGIAKLGAGADPLFSAFVNARPLARALEPFLPYESAEIGEALGIDGLDGAYWGSTAGKAGSLDALFIGLPGDPKGLCKALESKPAKLAAARYCREDSVLFATVSADWPAFVDSCQKLVEMLPEGVRAELARELRRELRRDLGIDMRALGERERELLSLVGSEVSVCITLPLQNGIAPEVLAFVELRDPKRAEQELTARLAKVLDGRRAPRLRSREFAGRTLWFVTSAETAPISPAYAVDGGMLILSPMRTTIEGALARADSGKGSLARSAEFRRAAERAGPAAMLCSIRLPVLARTVWPVLRPHLHAALEVAASDFAPDGLPYDVVPTADEVAQALGDYFCSAVADADGITLKEQQPVNFAAMLAAAGFAVDTVLQACERAGAVGSQGEAPAAAGRLR